MTNRQVEISGASREPARTARRARLLIIDDNAAVARSTALALGDDYDCVTVSGGREALALLDRGERFDVVLCDLVMPGMTGAELHAELHRRAPALAEKTLFLTGGATSPSAEAFAAAHEASVVLKPFSLERLIELIRARVG